MDVLNTPQWSGLVEFASEARRKENKEIHVPVAMLSDE